MSCENNHSDEADHSTKVKTCGVCASTFCLLCREAITGVTDKCPHCNRYVGDDTNNCRLGGGGCGK
jgi:hypothetical protein